MYVKKIVSRVLLTASLLFAPIALVLSNLAYFATMHIAYAGKILTDDGQDFYGTSGASPLSKAGAALVALMDQGQLLFNILIGLGILTSTLAFVVNAFKLGQTGEPKARAEATKNLVIIAITTAALGGFGFIYNIVIALIMK